MAQAVHAKDQPDVLRERVAEADQRPGLEHQHDRQDEQREDVEAVAEIGGLGHERQRDDRCRHDRRKIPARLNTSPQSYFS